MHADARRLGLGLVSVLLVLFVLSSTGCQRPDPAQPDPQAKALQAKAAESPTFGRILQKILQVGDALLSQVEKKLDQVLRTQELQATVHHWLIAAAIATGLLCLLGGAGKLLEGGAWAASPYGAVLVWIGRQVPLHAVIVSGLACTGCICLAIWLVPVWAFLVDLGKFVLLAAAFWLGWVLSCRRYTGEWRKDGLVRLPKGWQAAKE